MNRKHIVMAWLSIKSAFQYIPRIMAGTIGFSVLVGLLAVCGMNLSGDADSGSHMKVAVVVDQASQPKEYAYVKQAFGYLQNIESVDAVCDFDMEQSEEEAMQNLKKNQLTAVIKVPEGFVNGIMTGKNIPAVVILAEGSTTISAQLLQYMMQAGASDLSTAQAGIYAVDDAVVKYSDQQAVSANIADAEKQLNKAYFSYALDRGVYFDYADISETGSLSVQQFYVCSAVVLLLLLSGTTCGGLMKIDCKAFTGMAHRQGIISGEIQLFRTCGVCLVYFILLGTGYVLAVLSTFRYPIMKEFIQVDSIQQTAGSMTGIFVLIFSVMALVCLIFTIAANETSGVLLIFMITVVMVYASGLIVPAAILPNAVSAIGQVLPAYGYARLSSQILTGSVQASTVGLNLFYAAACMATGAVIEKKRSRYL